MAPIVSFLSDFGLLDPYVGIVKGVMLTLCPELTIVDLSHEVRPQSVEQGAFLAQQAWPFFPAGTVHLAVVDPGVGTTREALALRTAAGLFVGPDNGLLSAALPDALRRQAGSRAGTRVRLPRCVEARRISSAAVVRADLSSTFHGRDVFGPAAAWLAASRSFEDLGPALDCVTVLPPFCGERSADGVVGRIVHIDRFGNVISTIRSGELPASATQVRIGEIEAPIVRTYGDADGLVALVGSSGYLEVALVGGSAAALLGVGIGTRVTVERAMNSSRPRVVFMGSPEFAAPALRALVEAGYQVAAAYAQPDRPAGRGRQLTPPPVKLAAQELEIEVRQPESLRSAEAIAELRDLQPELIVVAAYGQILRPAVIDLPRFGCLNVHASLLPRHRGASCIAAAILAGDAETGVSIMQIDPGMDTGPILAQSATPIGDEDTTGSLTDRLAPIGAALLLEALPGYLSGAITPIPQDTSRATHAPLLEKRAGVIDWSKPAVQLWREVRAFNPWPLSTTRLGNDTLQILEAWPLPAGFEAGRPGMVVGLDGIADALPERLRRRAGFAVTTSAGLLAPLVVRRQGRPAATAAEFERGARGLTGAVLG